MSESSSGNPINIMDRLITVGDTTRIDTLIKKLNDLEVVITGTLDTAITKSAKYSDALKNVLDSADKLEKQIVSLDATEKGQQETIAKSATQADKLLKENDEYTASLKDMQQQIVMLTAQQQKLQTASKSVSTSQVAEAGSLASLKAQLKAATDEYTKFGTSVSQGVKDDQLKKINSLSVQVNTVDKALKSARSGIITAAGSYDKLKQEVSLAKAALQQMQGGINGNSKEFKDLQKFVADGTEQLKNFSSAIGDDRPNVWNYTSALKDMKAELKEAKGALIAIAAEFGEGSEQYKDAALRAGEINDKLKDTSEAINAVTGEPIERFTGSLGLLKNKLLSLDFKGAQGAIKQLGAASKDLTFKDASKGIAQFGKGMADFGKIILTNPIFLLIAAIALIVIGINKLKDVIKPLTILFDAVGQVIGKVIDAVKDFSDSLGLSAFQAEEYADRVIKAYDEAQAKITEYYDNEIKLANAAGANSFLLELKKQQAIQATAQAQIDALDKLKNKNASFYQFLAGKLNGWLNLNIDVSNKLSDDQQKAYDSAKKAFTDSNAEIVALEVKHFVDLRKIQDEHNDKLRDAAFQVSQILLGIEEKKQDKIASIEANGYVARNAASVKAQNIRIQLAKNEAEQEIKILNTQLRTLEERKATEISLTHDNAEQIKGILAQSQKEELLAVGANASKREEIIQRYADKAASLTTSGAKQREEILARFAIEEGNLQEEIATQTVGIEKKKQDAINQAQIKGIQDRKLIGIDELNQQINHNKSISSDILQNYNVRVEALINNGNLEEKLLKAQLDAKLINQREYNDKLRESENQLTNDLVEIFTQRAERLATIEQNKADAGTDQALLALNDSLANQQTSVISYSLKRKQIENDAATYALQRQIQLYKDERDNAAKFGKDTTEFDKKIADAEVQISDISTAQIIDGRTKVRDAAINLGQQAFDFASQLIQNSTDAQVQAYQNQIDALSSKKDQELAIVGDDAQAKAFIEQNYARQQKKIQDEANAAKRKGAIYQKAINIVQATANTALGVTEALGSTIPPFSFILAGLVAAAGAVQIASIASQQIPGFYKGVDYSPEGFAFVAERGPEAVIDPSGETSIVQKKQLRYLKKGSKVLTATETSKLMADADRYGDGYMMDKVVNGYNSDSDRLMMVSNDINAHRLVAAMDEQTRQIVEAVKNQPRDVWDDKGHRHYEGTLNARVQMLNKRYRLG